jgi:signal peptidase I
MIVDFALVMFIALLATGALWAFDRLFLMHTREQRAELLAREGKAEEAGLARREPVIVEYARAFFPVILIVFLIRSFLAEPFRIPSGSMMPNLLNGDFILVNKFSYGVRVPILNEKVVGVADPKRGEVVVFRFPGDPSVNYIKRVIGVPGDHVVYKRKQLFINGQPMELSDRQPYSSPHMASVGVALHRAVENIDGNRHAILITDNRDDGYAEFNVPAGQYFVMGDNRDHSNDSRYWGFVPDRHLVGRAFLIWFSLDTVSPDKWLWQRIVWNRIGDSIH